LPPVWVELPVPLAEGALEEADGLVLALPLAVVPVPGALSLIAPVPLDVEAVVLALGEVVLLVLLPAGAVVVVVVVVVDLSEPLMPELLLVVLADPACQSPRILTAWPTCAERSWLLCKFAILPFFSCSMKVPPCETIQPFRVLPSFIALESVLVCEPLWSVVVCVVVVWDPVVCVPMLPGVLLPGFAWVPLLGELLPPYPPCAAAYMAKAMERIITLKKRIRIIFLL